MESIFLQFVLKSILPHMFVTNVYCWRVREISHNHVYLCTRTYRKQPVLSIIKSTMIQTSLPYIKSFLLIFSCRTTLTTLECTICACIYAVMYLSIYVYTYCYIAMYKSLHICIDRMFWYCQFFHVFFNYFFFCGHHIWHPLHNYYSISYFNDMNVSRVYKSIITSSSCRSLSHCLVI